MKKVKETINVKIIYHFYHHVVKAELKRRGFPKDVVRKIGEEHHISIYAVSTYNTDYVSLKKENYQKGLENWMRQFFASKLKEMSKDIQSKIIKEVETLTMDKLWKGNEWIADYRRLRVVARI